MQPKIVTRSLGANSLSRSLTNEEGDQNFINLSKGVGAVSSLLDQTTPTFESTYIDWLKEQQITDKGQASFGAIKWQPSAYTYSDGVGRIEPHFASMAVYFLLGFTARDLKEYAANWLNYWALTWKITVA